MTRLDKSTALAMCNVRNISQTEVLRAFTPEPKVSANTQHIQFDQIKPEFGCLPKKEFIRSLKQF